MKKHPTWGISRCKGFNFSFQNAFFKQGSFLYANICKVLKGRKRNKICAFPKLNALNDSTHFFILTAQEILITLCFHSSLERKKPRPNPHAVEKLARAQRDRQLKEKEGGNYRFFKLLPYLFKHDPTLHIVSRGHVYL